MLKHYILKARRALTIRNREKYDPRWTPMLQNKEFNYFTKDMQEEDLSNPFSKQYHYFRKEDAKLARANHSLDSVRLLKIDDSILNT